MSFSGHGIRCPGLGTQPLYPRPRRDCRGMNWEAIPHFFLKKRLCKLLDRSWIPGKIRVFRTSCRHIGRLVRSERGALPHSSEQHPQALIKRLQVSIYIYIYICDICIYIYLYDMSLVCVWSRTFQKTSNSLVNP